MFYSTLTLYHRLLQNIVPYAVGFQASFIPTLLDMLCQLGFSFDQAMSLDGWTMLVHRAMFWDGIVVCTSANTMRQLIALNIGEHLK